MYKLNMKGLKGQFAQMAETYLSYLVVSCNANGFGFVGQKIDIFKCFKPFHLHCIVVEAEMAERYAVCQNQDKYIYQPSA